MAVESGTRLGQYEIRGLLGRGGMGEVYRAFDTKLRREVALKVLRPEVTNSAERRSRFGREARSMASLNTPNVASIYDFVEAKELCYLVIELVPGATLAEALAQGPLPVSKALHNGLQIAEALQAIHDKGIVHRDLKPPNIKVTPEGKVKLLDFGLAKLAELDPTDATVDTCYEEAATRPGMIMGTPAYMSPEQARGKEIDKRTDVWAFGCVLFEMLTGEPAFQGETVSDILAAVLQHEPNWNLLPAATPQRVRDLLARCLRKDPNRRPRDIGDLRIELEELLHGQREVSPYAPTLPAPDRYAQPTPGGLPPPGLPGGSSQPTSVWTPQGSGLATQPVAAAPAPRAAYPPPPPPPPASGGAGKVLLILLVFLAALGGAGYYFYIQSKTFDSLAVLPFQPVPAENVELRPWGELIASRVAHQLSQGTRLRIPTDPEFDQVAPDLSPREAGKKLGVQAVLTGKLQDRGDGLVLDVEILDVATGRLLYGDRFEVDRRHPEVFDVLVDEVVKKVRAVP